MQKLLELLKVDLSKGNAQLKNINIGKSEKLISTIFIKKVLIFNLFFVI